MELILLEKIQNLGDLGDRVRVKAGFGRNYLVPQGKAVAATAANVAMFDERRAELEENAANVLASANARKEGLDGVEVQISQQASAEGKLYGSVTNRDIASALHEAGHPVQRSEVILSDIIRETGEYAVQVQLHADVAAEIKLIVKPEVR